MTYKLYVTTSGSDVLCTEFTYVAASILYDSCSENSVIKLDDATEAAFFKAGFEGTDMVYGCVHIEGTAMPCDCTRILFVLLMMMMSLLQAGALGLAEVISLR